MELVFFKTIYSDQFGPNFCANNLLELFYVGQVYMDDSLGDRVWVDRNDCRAFVGNIETAFGTRLPSISMLASETAAKPELACKLELH